MADFSFDVFGFHLGSLWLTVRAASYFMHHGCDVSILFDLSKLHQNLYLILTPLQGCPSSTRALAFSTCSAAEHAFVDAWTASGLHTTVHAVG